MMSDDDDQQAAAWVVLIGVVLLAVGLAVGVGLQRSLKATAAHEATPMLTAATQTGAANTTDVSSPPVGSDTLAAQSSDTETSGAVAASPDSAAADAVADGGQADVNTADDVSSADASQVAAGEASAASDNAQRTTGAAVDDPSVRVDGEVVKFYFATARADLAEGAHDALADIIKGVAIGRTAVVSGFHDPTGDLASNQELARQRAQAVAEALRSLGVGEDKIELRKPEQTEVGGVNLAEARRVEVVLE